MMAKAPQTKGAFLPTEIVITILSFASDEDTVNENWQSTLFSCCLVCQQWYSAAIPFLYSKPVISARNYDSFAGTLDVRGKARHNIQEPLGNFVKHLDLGGLAHSGSKSVTARLLRACKEELEVFVAPASTFSTISLTPMSKCLNLRIVDLSVLMTIVPFLSIPHAVRNLKHLETLRFPPEMSHKGLPKVNDPHNERSRPLYQWPPKLKRLQLWRVHDSIILGNFIWPETVTAVTIIESNHYPFNTILQTLSTDSARHRLQRVRILSSRQTDEVSIVAPLCFQMEKLKFLSLQGCGCDPGFYRRIITMSPELAPLEILEISPLPLEHKLRVELVRDLKAVFAVAFPRVRLLGIAASCIDYVSEWFELEMDKALMENAKNSGHYDKEKLENGRIQTGVYYF
ncbi:F-box domain-containing protein [Trichophyton interdigitale]|uniref:F-box domain-containing protein n=1 Tax=Trichophyton interdigitale TaxID=101480 RepID=A0A9P5CY38_9EURO|nr:F-box domain-containing protein [Trichophyton interdigitale]KAF3899990.1 F-box domain-containing protein [Trichophyton interdigitale]KAG8209951.1 F-box domain-containing protein [Trichophyton interdigitale]